MKPKQDSPGVYFPPPLIYTLIFLIAFFMQKKVHIDNSAFQLNLIKGVAVLFFAAAIYFLVMSLTQFIKTKNTVVLIKPASSLQTGGVYGISRNPMYVALAFVFLGMTCLIGNWWNIILFPLLIFIMQAYIIKSEEKYLERAFGNKYLEYKRRVRRWL